MENLVVILARKNSKRLKNKNVIKINRKKLFDYTLEAALKCKKISNVRNKMKPKIENAIKQKFLSFDEKKSFWKNLFLHELSSYFFY